MRKFREASNRQFLGILALSGLSVPAVVAGAALAFTAVAQSLPFWLG